MCLNACFLIKTFKSHVETDGLILAGVFVCSFLCAKKLAHTTKLKAAAENLCTSRTLCAVCAGDCVQIAHTTGFRRILYHTFVEA